MNKEFFIFSLLSIVTFSNFSMTTPEDVSQEDSVVRFCSLSPSKISSVLRECRRDDVPSGAYARHFKRDRIAIDDKIDLVATRMKSVAQALSLEGVTSENIDVANLFAVSRHDLLDQMYEIALRCDTPEATPVTSAETSPEKRRCIAALRHQLSQLPSQQLFTAQSDGESSDIEGNHLFEMFGELE